jgi:hypothetical protein
MRLVGSGIAVPTSMFDYSVSDDEDEIMESRV